MLGKQGFYVFITLQKQNTMKNIIASIILIACCYQDIQAQLVYFNRVYNTDTTSMLSVAVKPFTDGYLIVGGFTAPLDYHAFYLRKINMLGYTETMTILDDCCSYSTLLFGNSFIETFDGNYVVSGVKGTDSDNRDFKILKFNQDGDELGNYLYETPESIEGNAQIIATQDGGYLLAGWTSNQVTATGSKFFIMKLDAGFNELWSATYGTWATLLYAEQTQDGGYVLSGYRYSNATGYDMYVVKTDSLGTLQWQKYFGTDENDNGCYVTQLANGEYRLLGAIDTPDKYYIAQLNTTGSEIWHKEYSFNEVCGNSTTPYVNELNQVFIVIYYYAPGQTKQRYLIKFSAEGDILWQMPLASGSNPNEDYLRDIEPTPDGGFVLAGFNYASPASSWVLKVDSLGHTCGIAPCDSIAYPIGIATSHTQAAQTTLHPNPAKGSTTITYSLPPQLPFVVLELYNLQGEKVRYWVLQPSLYPSQREGISQALDLAGIPPGMYVWRLALPGGYEQYEASGKLVVE
ncbi:T9SS C-terminal target domain-containing protein [Sphingobacteriales bacterium UPWRP_1]|nr:hypothetical protein BVG80_06690 [Sphingobacteriales bacterium TSM_CSM]PSJ74500.1 T9SS C-terminal target domain-containing protein [Sphingobacteriales bacterium UPWRP_1]